MFSPQNGRLAEGTWTRLGQMAGSRLGDLSRPTGMYFIRHRVLVRLKTIMGLAGRLVYFEVGPGQVLAGSLGGSGSI